MSDFTPSGVGVRPKLKRMAASTRALTKAQSALVRAHFQRLYRLYKTQTEAARAVGISQQVFNRVLKGDPAGLHIATKLAEFYKVGTDWILTGTPVLLIEAVGSSPGRWSSPATFAVWRAALDMERAQAESKDLTYWRDLLDRVARTLDPIVREETRKRG